ncbi:MAG: J domain-containing protein [Chloroflexi bacterium]|nr:J domain-containing protein [Chloroflexota bacterium]
MPSDEPDYYAVLGVSPDATPAQIEVAYRRSAARRMHATFRPDRAARELARINAAYAVLGYPDRRADYDARLAAPKLPAVFDDPLLLEGPPPTGKSLGRRQQLPRVTLGKTARTSSLEAIVILLVVAASVFAGFQIIKRPLVDLSFILDAADRVGISARRRPAVTPVISVAAPQSSPAPGASPVAVAVSSPEAASGPLGAVAGGASRYAGSDVRVSDGTPTRDSTISIGLTLMRAGAPAEGALVYLIAHYRTVDERWPANNGTTPTDKNGQATISFNIGNASSGYPVNVDVIALDGGQQAIWQTSFTPR